MLEATLTTAGSNKDLEEAGFLAIELMRVGLINADTMFLDYSGAPMRGTGRLLLDTQLQTMKLTSKQKLISVIVCWYLESHASGNFVPRQQATAAH